MEVRWYMVRFLAILLLFSVSVCYGQANRFAGFGSRNTCPVEALKFIDSSGITNQTEKDAVCTLVKQLKDSALWTSMRAVYPLLGRSSSSCKWNLMDIRQNDAAFRLVFFGGITFDSLGITGNGSNGYANTFFIPSLDYDSLQAGSYGVYLSKNVDELSCAIGMRVTVNPNAVSFTPRLSNIAYFSFTSTQTAVANTDSRGIYITTRLNRASSKTFKNGSLLVTHNTYVAATYNKHMFLLARNDDSGAAFFSTNTIGFAFIGSALTDAQSSTLYNIINTFKTTLGR